MTEGHAGHGGWHGPAAVILLSYSEMGLTARGIYREPACMPRDLLLYERVHVDLGRHASARCPQC